MTNKFKKSVAAVLMLVTSASSFAQSSQDVEMATGLYQSGKIYVVVVVATIIFAGIAAYLVLLDRKISKLEKEIKNK